MTTIHALALDRRGVIAVKGADARPFLQGIVTVDVETIEQRQSRYGALLTPQGKILHGFHIHPITDGVLLDTAKTGIADLLKRLKMYRLRAKIDLVEREDLAVIAAWGDGVPEHPDFAADPRVAALGARAIAGKAMVNEIIGAIRATPADIADYDRHRIGCGVPEYGVDYPSGEVFPHEADLDQLHGVDFAKGCFVGQEVVSRMQHRGTARKRFVPVQAAGQLPTPGTDIQAGGKSIGSLASSVGADGLALIRLDRLEDAIASGKPVTADTVTLEVRKPAWASFDMPAATVPAS